MSKLSKGLARVRTLARHRSLCASGAELALLGRSRGALDIAKLSEELKVRQALERRYGAMIDASAPAGPLGKPNRTVWICWLQGIDGAPELVKKCFASVQACFSGWEIVVLTSDNLSRYAELSPAILDKWKRGVISAAHFSDLLRVDLLTRLGGLWLDATVFCTGGLSDAFIESNDLFLYQILPPNALGRSLRCSSWLIWARSGCRVLAQTRALLWAYWEKEDALFDYYLLHHFIAMVMDRFPEDARRILPRGTSAPHQLQFRLFDPYVPAIWDDIRAQADFHKLTYRLDPGDVARKGTFYDAILR